MYNMKLLEERIKKDGQVRPGHILKVDGFLNHQIDPVLYGHIADEIYRMMAQDLGPDRVAEFPEPL